MTRDDIIRMAREAGSIDSEDVIQTVYAAFAAAEREECAKVCDTCGRWGDPVSLETERRIVDADIRSAMQRVSKT